MALWRMKEGYCASSKMDIALFFVTYLLLYMTAWQQNLVMKLYAVCLHFPAMRLCAHRPAWRGPL